MGRHGPGSAAAEDAGAGSAAEKRETVKQVLKLRRPGLITSYLLVVTAFFALYTFLDYSKTMAEAEHESRDLLNQSSNTVHAELSRVVDSVNLLFNQVQYAHDTYQLDFVDYAGSNRLFIPLLQLIPFVSSVNYGNASGDGYLLLHVGDFWKNRVKRASEPDMVTWLNLAADGTVVSREGVPDNYDPRNRPWYKVALQKPGIQWGSPYLFRTTRDLGVTASMVVDKADQAVGEVIGVDLMLKDLSRFLARINLKRNITIDVIDSEGFIYANSAFATFEQRLAKSSGSPPAITSPEYGLQRAIISSYLQTGKDFLTASFGGKLYFAKVDRFQLSADKELITVLSISKQLYLVDFIRNFARNLVLFLLFLTLVTVFFMFGHILPLRRLTNYVRAYHIDSPPVPLAPTGGEEIQILTNSINGFIKTIREQTTALQISEEHYRTLVQNAGSIILRWDTGGNITFINDHGAEFFGYKTEDLIGKNVIGTIVAPTDSSGKDLCRMIEDICASPERYRSNENENITRDGRTVHINWANVGLLDESGVPFEILSVGNDVTDRVRAENELRLLNEELEERIRERTADYETSNLELEAFSYSVSHDLQAPLRNIDGFSRILVDEYLEEMPDEAQELVVRIRRSVRRMETLISDLLNLARVTRQKIDRCKVNLSELANDIFAEFRIAEPDRKVEVNIESGMITSGDPTLLRMALFNLLENAWKYTSRNHGATITFGTERSNGNVVYFVRDNGVGFDMQYSEKLFGAFQRLHSASDFEGTGIGLATVQRIIQRHGGKVWAKAEVDKGATVYFTL